MKQGVDIIAPDDLTSILSLNCHRYVVGHYWLDTIAGIRGADPAAKILVRYMTKDFLGSDPASFARDFCAEAEKWRPYTSLAYFANEPNNPVENPSADMSKWPPAAINQWLFAVAREIRNLAPWLKIYCPPFSPPYQAIESYYDLSRYDHLDALFDGICVNAYGTSAEIIAYCQQVQDILPPDIPLWLSETNYGAGRDVKQVYGAATEQEGQALYAQDMPKVFGWIDRNPRWQAACVFAYRWPTPDTHLPSTVDVKGQPIENAIRGYKMSDVDLTDQINLLQQQVQVLANQAKQLLDQNALLTAAIKAYRTGNFDGSSGDGANSVDGLYMALRGGAAIDYVPSYPPKA